MRAARCMQISLALAAILAGAVGGLVLANVAEAGPGGRGGFGGGGFHGGGGGGFHGGMGGGFHGGMGGGMGVFRGGMGGGFRGGMAGGFQRGMGGGFQSRAGFRPGRGFHSGGGLRGGGFHSFRPAPSGGRGGHGYSARSLQSRSSDVFAGHTRHGSRGSVAPSRSAASNHIASQRSGSVVKIRNALGTQGGLRNPMTRAAITAGVASAAWSHRNVDLWWRHAHGGLGWVGPVFWPYADYDLYDYAWWGGDYNPFFWDYGYTDIYVGLFGVYSDSGLNAYADFLPGYAASGRRARPSSGSKAEASLSDMCGSSQIASFRAEQFRGAIQPNSEQSATLDELADTLHRAADVIRNSCPKDVALTAPSRLAAMQQRVEGMRSAVSIVKPALDKFYGLLSDEQKAKIGSLAADQQSSQQDVANNSSCDAAQSIATEWPSELIKRDVKPTDAQRASLSALQDAAGKAADILKSSCPPTDADTPPARLAAVATRLDAMLEAIGAVRPALDSFYKSLTDQQKAAFDAIGAKRNGAISAFAGDRQGAVRPHQRSRRKL